MERWRGDQNDQNVWILIIWFSLIRSWISVFFMELGFWACLGEGGEGGEGGEYWLDAEGVDYSLAPSTVKDDDHDDANFGFDLEIWSSFFF